MIITLPHYIFENKESYQIINDDSVIVAKSSTYKKDKISLRNSMHLAILLVSGGKILHLEDDDISIDTSDILFYPKVTILWVKSLEIKITLKLY